jgi:hypothetical protein
VAWERNIHDIIMSAHKKQSIANKTIQVDQQTFDLIECKRDKSETKGEAIKRLIS